MKRSIDLLSAKFVEAGLVIEGETYKTPLEPIPLGDLLVESEEQVGPMMGNSVQAEPIPTEGLSVNFVARRIEGTISMNESQLQKAKNALNKILKLHDDLRSGASVKIVTGFVLE